MLHFIIFHLLTTELPLPSAVVHGPRAYPEHILIPSYCVKAQWLRVQREPVGGFLQHLRCHLTPGAGQCAQRPPAQYRNG